jgi:hypothetical protein
MLVRSLFALALVGTMGCASSGTSGKSGARRNPNVITQSEFVASNEGNAYDAISILRPMFLKSRGRTTINAETTDYATVFVDGQRYGDLTSLRNIVASQIIEARYLNATDAVGKYGMRYGSGVIDIRTR